jgi:SNF2 family DNA or RNA helicase
LNLIQELDTPFAKQYLSLFDSVWKDKKRLVDVKEELIKSISAICAENSPEFVYYVALYNIFNDFLNDISDDDFSANERVGYQNSVVWTKLYDFQRDAALAIINKLERYNGCILADSVGLGKTYTSLAVIKYYESRNKTVLVLCPKKLSDNWLGFRGNLINNPLVKDRFRYDVFYHTDMSRIASGAKTNGIDLSHINWGKL